MTHNESEFDENSRSGSVNPGKIRLSDVRLRDGHILADPSDRRYRLTVSAPYYRAGIAGFGAVWSYVSTDLIGWEGPYEIFRTPEEFWPGCAMKGIWAPELHFHHGIYYLFLTFNTSTPLPEQWRGWLPRVRRGSQILSSESPLGPFRPFDRRPTAPEDMMTLDGTLYVENEIPYMVFCHEWVQIVNGTVERVRLSDDLSGRVAEPELLFRGSDAPWMAPSKDRGCFVTDGPSLYRSGSGRLFMIWSGFGKGGYTTGVAVSDSGNLAGPWRQNEKPLFEDDGGHGCLFTGFDGQLMLALHQPNRDAERIRLFELEDTGETLRIIRPFGPA